MDEAITLKILFQISDKIEEEYLESLKNIINDLKEEITDKEIIFQIAKHKFNGSETKEIENDPSSFLYTKLNLKREEIKSYAGDKYNAVIYIPDSSINLEGNYIWYSSGNPRNHAMMISSYIFKGLIKNVKNDLGFGAYALLVYSQFLSRFSVLLDRPHEKSQNCLNDHCGNQEEILNVFENKDDVLCKYCRSAVIENKYYSFTKKIIGFIKNKYFKKTEIVKLPASASIVKPEKSKVKFIPYGGYRYELEIFIAKKCTNLYKLYGKLDKLLNCHYSEIEGYSLYEVDGGWRGTVTLSKANQQDWETLKSLKIKYGESDFKDLIKPIFENANNDKFAAFDERSIVLKIVIKSDNEIKSWDENSNQAIREIMDILQEITSDEKSLFVTMKKLDIVGGIEKA